MGGGVGGISVAQNGTSNPGSGQFDSGRVSGGVVLAV